MSQIYQYYSDLQYALDNAGGFLLLLLCPMRKSYVEQGISY
jgi:hypothetical protein